MDTRAFIGLDYRTPYSSRRVDKELTTRVSAGRRDPRQRTQCICTLMGSRIPVPFHFVLFFFLFSESNIRIGLIIWNGCIYLFRDHDGALAALIGHAFMDMCERQFFFIPIDVSLVFIYLRRLNTKELILLSLQ